MYVTITAKTSNFWMFWSITLLIYSVNIRFLNDDLLAELQARMSRSCRFFCFFASYIAHILKTHPYLFCSFVVKIHNNCVIFFFIDLTDRYKNGRKIITVSSQSVKHILKTYPYLFCSFFVKIYNNCINFFS